MKKIVAIPINTRAVDTPTQTATSGDTLIDPVSVDGAGVIGMYGGTIKEKVVRLVGIEWPSGVVG
jgi:hypothetical protein